MDFVNRTGLARLLDCCEATTRNMETRGEIAPEGMIGGRPYYSVAKAKALKQRLDAARRERVRTKHA